MAGPGACESIVLLVARIAPAFLQAWVPFVCHACTTPICNASTTFTCSSGDTIGGISTTLHTTVIPNIPTTSQPISLTVYQPHRNTSKIYDLYKSFKKILVVTFSLFDIFKLCGSLTVI
ncbi:hypothetical protein OTU49_016932 [Cherax quadricarinatus]|uniref:Secreted protein n=1 Tax=Cherax quadricarinatus TaxID=27406 RepID=A0AAW0Y4L9_CHEQU